MTYNAWKTLYRRPPHQVLSPQNAENRLVVGRVPDGGVCVSSLTDGSVCVPNLILELMLDFGWLWAENATSQGPLAVQEGESYVAFQTLHSGLMDFWLVAE
jgi:hypothetical protein